jgi:dTDP-4-amino-4,6-dideoxygalactose transaminase
MPPPGCDRDALRAVLAEHEIGSATYFSPHLAEQPYFQPLAPTGDLQRTETVAQRILALPMSDTISVADVDRVCSVLRDAAAATLLSHAA